jgi:hypothetical protein
MAKKSNIERRRWYAGLQAGIKKLWMKGGTVQFFSKSWPPQQLVDLLQSLIDAIDAQDKAFAAYQGRVHDRRTLEKKWSRVMRSLTGLALATHAGDARALSVFDLSEPKKTGPKTVVAKAAMVEKAKSTREARGTKGKKARRR